MKKSTPTGKLYVVDSPMGMLVLDEDSKLIDKALFPKKPELAAERILKLERGEVDQETEKLIETLKKKCGTFVLENSGLAESIRKMFNVNVDVEKPSNAGEHVRSNLGLIAVQTEFSEKPEEFYEFIRKASTELAKLKVKEKAAKRDKIIVQIIKSLDELDKSLNLLAGRISEWYGLHFPELAKVIDSHETYARLITTLGRRENFTAEKLAEMGITKKTEMIAEMAGKSMGAPMHNEDLETLQSMCRMYLEMVRTRHSLHAKVDELMADVSPNLRAVAGPTLGARLIALGGGLNRLSRFPASTFQILGAEKALFRFLKTGSRPPKHGVIFQHPLVHQAPKWQRGKVSRALSGKLAIAARIDAFSGVNAGEKLKEDLEKRIDEIREKYKAPPQLAKKPVKKLRRKKS